MRNQEELKFFPRMEGKKEAKKDGRQAGRQAGPIYGALSLG